MTASEPGAASLSKMKKILIVSYHFPPDASVGALRAAKFAKYLPQFCWSPIILSVRDSYYAAIDESKLKDVASVAQIYRTRMLPHLSRIYLSAKTRFQKREADTESDKTKRSPTKGSTILSFPRRLFLSLECLPDEKQVWIPAATWVGLRIIAREKVDAIFTSGPPMSCHVIGLLLKAATGRRWIADFRDPWMTHREDFVLSTKLSKAIEGWLEKQTIIHADKVVLATDRMQADLHQRYPESIGKTTVILNGYDPRDFDDHGLAQRPSDRQYFTLTHAGSIYYKRTAEPFLVGLSRLIKSGRIPRARVRVNFIGSSPGVQERCRELEIDDVVRVAGAMDYPGCIQCLYRSDVLLLFAQDQPLQIPTKFYDYVAVKKPILVVAEEGATVDLARNVGGPIVIRPNDGAHLETRLKELYGQFERNALSSGEWNDEWIQRELTKVVLTRKLVNVIN
jgi:glycosyltransferase involved in cell wall biosynthesis